MREEAFAKIQTAMELCRSVIDPLARALEQVFDLREGSVDIAAAISWRGSPGLVATTIKSPSEVAALLNGCAKAIEEGVATRGTDEAAIRRGLDRAMQDAVKKATEPFGPPSMN